MNHEATIQQRELESTNSKGEPTAEAPRSLARIIAALLSELQKYLTVIVSDANVEAIHKMRVTTRRLQACLDLLKFNRNAKEISEIRKQLQQLRQKLSEVRNYDVFLLLLDQEADSRKSIREPFETLKEELQKRRIEKVEEVTSYLKEVNIQKLTDDLRFDIQEPEIHSLNDFADDRQIARRAAERLEQRLEEFQQLAKQIEPTTHPEELHQLRIAAKRLRYLLEIAACMGYGKSLTALNWLRTLQDRIGDWHDIEALEDEVITFVAHREFMKSHLVESNLILTAVVHLHRKKKTLANSLFPFKVNPRVVTTSRRIIKAFHKAALDAKL